MCLLLFSKSIVCRATWQAFRYQSWQKIKLFSIAVLRTETYNLQTTFTNKIYHEMFFHKHDRAALACELQKTIFLLQASKSRTMEFPQFYNWIVHTFWSPDLNIFSSKFAHMSSINQIQTGTRTYALVYTWFPIDNEAFRARAPMNVKLCIQAWIALLKIH